MKARTGSTPSVVGRTHCLQRHGLLYLDEVLEVLTYFIKNSMVASLLSFLSSVFLPAFTSDLVFGSSCL